MLLMRSALICALPWMSIVAESLVIVVALPVAVRVGPLELGLLFELLFELLLASTLRPITASPALMINAPSRFSSVPVPITKRSRAAITGALVTPFTVSDAFKIVSACKAS